MTPDETKAVLAMSEEEQYSWVSDYCTKNKIDNTKLTEHPSLCEDYEVEISLEELAFRLRDEARKNNLDAWNNAIYIVASYVNDSPLSDYKGHVPNTIWQWAQHIILNQDEYPLYIIWILAAMQAKENE